MVRHFQVCSNYKLQRPRETQFLEGIWIFFFSLCQQLNLDAASLHISATWLNFPEKPGAIVKRLKNWSNIHFARLASSLSLYWPQKILHSVWQSLSLNVQENNKTMRRRNNGEKEKQSELHESELVRYSLNFALVLCTTPDATVKGWSPGVNWRAQYTLVEVSSCAIGPTTGPQHPECSQNHQTSSLVMMRLTALLTVRVDVDCCFHFQVEPLPSPVWGDIRVLLSQRGSQFFGHFVARVRGDGRAVMSPCIESVSGGNLVSFRPDSRG